MKSAVAAKPWPRLSEQLTGPRQPDHCQSCGAAAGPNLARWIEHDDQDRPEPVVIVLCTPCSDKLVEAHARLYDRLDRNVPFPGCMSVCLDCRFRDHVRCTSTAAKINGGPGLDYEFEGGQKPSGAHVDYSDKKGRRCGRWMTIFPARVSVCSGKEPIPEGATDAKDHQPLPTQL